MSFRPGVVILCQYVKTDGIVCGSPALRERRFCYFHQEWHNQRIRLAFGLSTEGVALARKRPSETSRGIVVEKPLRHPDGSRCPRIGKRVKP